MGEEAGLAGRTVLPILILAISSIDPLNLIIGIALGAAIGGVALSLHGWAAVGAAYGAMRVVAAVVYHTGVQSGGDRVSNAVSPASGILQAP